MRTIRLWLAKEWPFLYGGLMVGLITGAVVFVVLWGQSVEAQSSIDLGRESAIANVAVQNSTAVAFSNPLHGANFIQITLNAGDAQVFTYCPPQGGACAEVPSGQGFQIGTLRREMPYGQALGTVQTATDAATLQVVAQRVR